MLHFERRTEALLPRREYLRRLLMHGLLAVFIIAVSLFLGVLGYHYLEQMSWIEALLNASMILGGMGPVDVLHTKAGKIFASCYAIFSGVIFIGAVGLLFAPIFHRFLHRFHLETGSSDSSGPP